MKIVSHQNYDKLMFVFKINEDDIDIDKNIGEKFYKALSKSKSYNY